MEPVRVKKTDLVTRLEKNKKEHVKIFDEAVEGYRKKVTQILEDHLKRVKSGSLVRVMISLPEPSDHTKDYERALEMMAMSLDDEIEIDETTFSELVMDDWSWKREFLTTNSAYSAMAAKRL